MTGKLQESAGRAWWMLAWAAIWLVTECRPARLPAADSEVGPPAATDPRPSSRRRKMPPAPEQAPPPPRTEEQPETPPPAADTDEAIPDELPTGESDALDESIASDDEDSAVQSPADEEDADEPNEMIADAQEESAAPVELESGAPAGLVDLDEALKSTDALMPRKGAAAGASQKRGEVDGPKDRQRKPTDREPPAEVRQESAAPPRAIPGGGRLPATSGRQGILRDSPLPLGPAHAEPALDTEGTPSLDELLRAPRPVVDPARFKDVQPGKSTLEDLTAAWGSAKSVKRSGGSSEYLYDLKPFRKAAANVADGKVTSIAITLARPHSAKELARQLGIDDVESVLVYDDAGQLLGQAFPERGVLFALVDEDSHARAAQILLEPIDPQAFALRAEQRADARTAMALADVDFALELSPRLPRAHAVRAQVLLAAGDLRGARTACEASLKYEKAPEYRLTLARICIAAADYPAAIEECRRVVDAAGSRPLVKAWAYQLWGEAVGASPERDYQQAIRHHQQAIKMAEQLAIDKQTPLRRSAKRLLLEAHLGVATDVAWGNWQQKPQVVPKWLERAHAIAEDLVASEDAGDDVRFQMAVGALATLGGMSEPLEGSVWLGRALKHGRALLDHEPDAVRKARISWQLGLALADGSAIEHARRQQALAVEHAKAAIDYLNAGQVTSVDWPMREFVVGRLLYRIGAIYAVDKHDHHEALAWYERATSLLENPVPGSALADPGRHGEMFVSMAVSHWEAGNRSEAMRLTEQGLRLMEQGVASGLLDRAALGVPYENLAGMHEALGDAERAKYFASLAKTAGQTQPR